MAVGSKIQNALPLVLPTSLSVTYRRPSKLISLPFLPWSSHYRSIGYQVKLNRQALYLTPQPTFELKSTKTWHLEAVDEDIDV